MQFLLAISMATPAQLVEWAACLQTFGDALGELDQMRGSLHFIHMARKESKSTTDTMYFWPSGSRVTM